MAPRPTPLPERFWAHVDRAGDHWLWTASCRTGGQPQFVVDGRPQPARRVAWELTHGPLPARQRVYVACGVTICMRPDHLTLDGAAGARERRTLADLWTRVDRTGGADACWIWQGRLDARSGLPAQTRIGRRFARPIEHAWHAEHGAVPSGQRLRRVCHEVLCVNPRHWHTVTATRELGPARNRGEDKPNAKLTWESVEELRSRYAEGQWSYAAIGREFGVAAATAAAAIQRRTWITRDEAVAADTEQRASS